MGCRLLQKRSDEPLPLSSFTESRTHGYGDRLCPEYSILPSFEPLTTHTRSAILIHTCPATAACAYAFNRQLRVMLSGLTPLSPIITTTRLACNTRAEGLKMIEWRPIRACLPLLCPHHSLTSLQSMKKDKEGPLRSLVTLPFANSHLPNAVRRPLEVMLVHREQNKFSEETNSYKKEKCNKTSFTSHVRKQEASQALLQAKLVL